jgi:hypothetical protein
LIDPLNLQTILMFTNDIFVFTVIIWSHFLHLLSVIIQCAWRGGT